MRAVFEPTITRHAEKPEQDAHNLPLIVKGPGGKSTVFLCGDHQIGGYSPPGLLYLPDFLLRHFCLIIFFKRLQEANSQWVARVVICHHLYLSHDVLWSKMQILPNP